MAGGSQQQSPAIAALGRARLIPSISYEKTGLGLERLVNNQRAGADVPTLIESTSRGSFFVQRFFCSRDHIQMKRTMKAATAMAALAAVLAAASGKAAIVEYSETFSTNSTTDGWYLFTGTTTGQAIDRLNGAGPRKDWADNDDTVVQDALNTGDPLPPGGTITGDGLLADGALMWTVGNTTKGDERIAYNLGGLNGSRGRDHRSASTSSTMSPYYNQIAGYLYDRTTGTQLMADPWVSSKAWSDPAYTPVDNVVTYTCPPENDGHELAIVFREWHNHTNRVGYFDNISVTSTGPGNTGVLAYSNVFVGGEEGPLGTSNYRIPSITVAPNGDLLAFAEARRSSSDAGARRVPDRTWSSSDPPTGARRGATTPFFIPTLRSTIPTRGRSLTRTRAQSTCSTRNGPMTVASRVLARGWAMTPARRFTNSAPITGSPGRGRRTSLRR